MLRKFYRRDIYYEILESLCINPLPIIKTVYGKVILYPSNDPNG